MNLWAKRLGLPFLAVLALFSCEEENTVGLPPEDDLGIFFAEIPMNLRTSQVWADDLPGDLSGRMIVGQYDDPQFGRISSVAYADLTPNGFRNLINPDSTQLEYEFVSASMQLRINEAFGQLQGTPNVTLSLYQLADIVDPGVVYTNSSSIPLGDKIGEANFDFYSDSLGLEFSNSLNLDSTLFDADSVYIYTTEFSLEQSFWQNTLEGFVDILRDTINFPDSVLNQAFDDLSKGIALISESDGTAIIYNALDAASSIQINFTSSDGVTTEDRELLLAINNSRAFNEIAPNANTGWTLPKFDPINEFYSPTPLDDPNAYIQSGTNLFLTLDFSGFRNFADTASNAIFSEAVLFINGDGTLLDEGIDPLNQLEFTLASDDALAERDLSSSTNVNIQRELPGRIAINNDSINQINLPTYLNQLVLNRINLDKVVVRSPLVSSLSRIVIPKDSIFLRVTYSKTN